MATEDSDLIRRLADGERRRMQRAELPDTPGSSPRDVLALRKAERHGGSANAYLAEADADLAALSAAGLAVVPAGETREEWGLRRPDGVVVASGQPRAVEERDIAEEESRPDGIRGCILIRRETRLGPWEPVQPDAADG